MILIDQLKEIYIDGELEPIETANWFPKVMRKDYTVGAQHAPAAASTTPTSMFYENYACGSERNYNGYCNPELDKLFDQQSMRSRPGKAQAAGLGDRTKLQEDGARPIIFHNRAAHLLAARRSRG